MKKILILVLMSIIFLSSCDPDYTSRYIIENKSQKDITLYFFGEIYNDTVDLKNDSLYYLVNSLNNFGGPVIFDFNAYDSVSIYSDEFIKTFYKNSETKSILNQDDWIQTINDRMGFHQELEYRFTILNEDLN